jgi:hypothetical protein
MPKSSSLTCPLEPSLMFDDLMSRWRMPRSVEIGNRFDHGTKDGERFVPRQAGASLLYAIMEGDAVNILHDDARTPFKLDKIIEFGNIGMMQPGLDSRLVDEALGQAQPGLGTREYLDGNNTPDPRVNRTVYLAHATCPERFE